MTILKMHEVRSRKGVHKGFQVTVLGIRDNGKKVAVTVPTDTKGRIRPDILEGVRTEKGVKLPENLFV